MGDCSLIDLKTGVLAAFDLNRLLVDENLHEVFDRTDAEFFQSCTGKIDLLFVFDLFVRGVFALKEDDDRFRVFPGQPFQRDAVDEGEGPLLTFSFKLEEKRAVGLRDNEALGSARTEIDRFVQTKRFQIPGLQPLKHGVIFDETKSGRSHNLVPRRLGIVDTQVPEAQVRTSDFDTKPVMAGLILRSGPLNNFFHLRRLSVSIKVVPGLETMTL